MSQALMGRPAPAARAPSYRRLEAFLVAARTLSLLHAAAELGVGKDQVRRRIRELERELGCVLARFRGDVLQLTSNGARLLREAGPELAAVARAWQAQLDASEEPLVVAASPVTMSLWLAPRLAEWAEGRPPLRIQTVRAGAPFGADGEDVVFTPAPFSTDPRETCFVVTARMVCVAAAPPTAGELSGGLPREARLLDPARGPAYRSIWDLWFRARGVTRLESQVIAPVDDLMLRQCVLRGQGVSLWSLDAAKDDLAAGRVHLQSRIVLPFRYYLRWRPEVSESASLHKLREFLSEEARQLDAEQARLMRLYGCEEPAG